MAHRLILLALAFALFYTISATTRAQTSAIIAVSPPAQTVNAASTFNVDYTVDDVSSPGVGGYVLTVRWNPALLEMTSLFDAGYVTNGDLIVICGAPSIDNAAGIGVLFCSPLPVFAGPGLETSTPQVLARSTFRALAPGTTTIDISESRLEGPPNSAALESQKANGSVTVQTDATAVPATATPVNSAVPEPSASTSPAGGADAAVSTNSATASTTTAGRALSEIEAPPVGTGDASDSPSATQWIFALTAVGAALGLSATGILLWKRHRGRMAGPF